MFQKKNIFVVFSLPLFYFTYDKCVSTRWWWNAVACPAPYAPKRDVKEWRYAYDVLLKSKQTQLDEIQEMDDEGYSHLHQLEDTLQDSFF